MKTYISGRNNLALTVMMPYDCPNNCPFCTAKEEYKKNAPNAEKVVKTLRRFFEQNKNLDVKEVVITGGEPMSNLPLLQILLRLIPKDKDIYINTTAIKQNFDTFVKIVNYDSRIKGVNISRHFTRYEYDCRMLRNIVEDSQLEKINKSVRINAVINDNNNDIDGLIMRWQSRKVELSLREDFTTMTAADLHNPYTKRGLTLATDHSLKYMEHTQCNVCDTTIFKYSHTGLIVRYHKGLQNTMLPLGNGKYEINDIIIRQDGEIFTDWTFKNSTTLSWWAISGEKEKENVNNFFRSFREETPSYSCGGIACRNGNPFPYSRGYEGGCGGGYGGCSGGVNYTTRLSCGGGGCSSCG